MPRQILNILQRHPQVKWSVIAVIGMRPLGQRTKDLEGPAEGKEKTAMWGVGRMRDRTYVRTISIPVGPTGFTVVV